VRGFCIACLRVSPNGAVDTDFQFLTQLVLHVLCPSLTDQPSRFTRRLLLQAVEKFGIESVMVIDFEEASRFEDLVQRVRRPFRPVFKPFCPFRANLSDDLRMVSITTAVMPCPPLSMTLTHQAWCRTIGPPSEQR